MATICGSQVIRDQYMSATGASPRNASTASPMASRNASSVIQEQVEYVRSIVSANLRERRGCSFSNSGKLFYHITGIVDIELPAAHVAIGKINYEIYQKGSVFFKFQVGARLFPLDKNLSCYTDLQVIPTFQKMPAMPTVLGRKVGIIFLLSAVLRICYLAKVGITNRILLRRINVLQHRPDGQQYRQITS